MDPHSIKRPRIMPLEEKALQLDTNAAHHPSTLSNGIVTPHKPSDLALGHWPSANTPTVGLGSQSTLDRPLCARPSSSLQRRPSYSNQHSKDNLFHKDTNHRDTLMQQRQAQDDQKRHQQQLRLQEAHREFHHQRELYQERQKQQQQRQQQQQQQQQQRSTCSSTPSPQSSSSPQPQRPAALPCRHHHHHHHHHIHPVFTNASTNHLQLNSLLVGQHHYALSLNTRPISTSGRPSSPSSSSATVPGSSSNQALLPSTILHHHHHHLHHGSLHQQHPQRSSQFSEWTTVKEKERARLLSHMARIRETQTPLPSAETAKENLKRLSQRIHQRRTRARETILYDLHQGVKTVEAQVHKQVDMVLSRLKDAPGSKYAFALTHTFLTQIPQALSNTILPSAISAVADTVAGRTTNSLTTLRGRAGLDDEDDEDEDDEDEDDQENMDALDDINYQPQMALMQCHPHQDPGWSQQLSHEFGTIALAPSSSPCSCGSGAKSTTKAAESSTHMESKEREATISEPTSGCSSSSEYENGTVSISSAGASEFLSASTHHNYSTAASQVLSAALPSFIPSMVAPIVCVFSYPSPPTTKPNSPSHSTPSSPSVFGGSHGQPSPALTATEGQTFAAMQQKRISTEDTRLDKDLEAAIKADPGIAEVTSSAWTTAEREALFLAATRFRLRGQWSRVRAMMRLHRTDREIEAEYHRLYGEESEEDGDEDRQGSNDDLVAIKKESDADDGDADDEAEATVFMRFGGRSRPPSSSATSSALQDTAQMASLQSSLTDIQPLPITLAAGPSAQRYPHHHADGQDHCLQSRSHAQHQLCPSERFLRTPLKEKPLRIVKKEFMIDKRFTLEEIPIRL